MNQIKRLFLRILQNNIILDDNIVPVIIKDYWADMTPCITITGRSRDRGKTDRQYVTVQRPLPENHNLYNHDNPLKKYPHLAETTKHSYTIQLNVWCNDEREREKIVDSVKNQLFLARNNHYSHCSKYDKETFECKTINEECKARTTTGYKQLRGLCPSPHEYKCCSLLKAYGVIKSSISIGSDYEQDEYDHKPPLKRSIINIELNYYETTVFPSNPVNCYDTPDLQVGK